MTRNKKSIDHQARVIRDFAVDAASPKRAGTNRESSNLLKSNSPLTRGGTRKRAATKSETACQLKSKRQMSRRRSNETKPQLKSASGVSQAAALLTTAQLQRDTHSHSGRRDADLQPTIELLRRREIGVTNTTARVASEAQDTSGGRIGIIQTIATNYREYRTFEKAETKLTLQIKGICRSRCGGDKTKGTALHDHLSKPQNFVFAESEIGVGGSRLIELRATLAAPKNDLQRAMEALVEKLPIWTQWGQHQFGFSSWGLAKLIAEVQSHDPQYPYLAFGNYETASRIWKRFGLAVIDGQRQQRISHDADLAIRHGYNARRRSIAWVTIFGATSPGCVLNAQKRIKNRKGSTAQTKYRDIMEQRLADETAWNAAGKYQTQAALILADAKKRKKKLVADNRKELEAGRLTPSHLSNRARCYAGKRFLADLWGAWHKTMPAAA